MTVPDVPPEFEDSREAYLAGWNDGARQSLAEIRDGATNMLAQLDDDDDHTCECGEDLIDSMGHDGLVCPECDL